MTENTNNPLERRMIVCPVCGDKRCPRATDCSLECTGEPLQDALAREANYREQIESLLKARQRYENQLALTAAVLQEALTIGKVKHIGLLEVAAGVAELVKQRDGLAAVVEELTAAMRAYEMDVDADPTNSHRALMERARKARGT